MTTKDTLTLLRDIKWRVVQIASGDYKACGVFAEDVAKDAMPDINELIRRASVGADECHAGCTKHVCRIEDGSFTEMVAKAIAKRLPSWGYVNTAAEVAIKTLEPYLRHHLAPVTSVWTSPYCVHGNLIRESQCNECVPQPPQAKGAGDE